VSPVRLELVGAVEAPIVLLAMPSGTVVAISDREFVRALRELVELARRSHPKSPIREIVVPADH